jgi:type III secretory pathway component EscT
MFEAFPEVADVKAIAFYVLTCIMRPLGLLTTFGLMNFALKKATMIRVAMAMVLGAPVAVANQPILFEIYQEGKFANSLFLPGKELLIGLAFGFLASLPFYGFKYAGALIDNYRGESSNNLHLEGGETVTTIGLLFYIAAAATFAVSDGLWHLMRSFYSSYAFWPVQTFLPPLNPNAYKFVLDQLWQVLLTMIRIGIPLLFLMFIAELLVIIAARVSRRFQLGGYASILKSLVLVLLLPSYITLVVMIAEDQIASLAFVHRTLDAVFQ